MSTGLKRFISIALVITLLCCCFSTVVFANASVTIESLKLKYPDGKYWNGGDADSYTDKPCTHHGNCSKYGYDGWCGCNTYKNQAIQCMGFAYQLAYLVYGGEPYNWIKDVNEKKLRELKAGDIIRYHKYHSIFVCAVDGDVVTYADCNWNGNCNIRWDNTITKSEILSDNFMYIQSAPYEWGNGEAPCSCSTSFVGEYICSTESLPLRIRSGHSTEYSTIGWIPSKATVYVSKSDGGWAHVTYNGLSGYASMEYLTLVKGHPYVEFDNSSLVLSLEKYNTATLTFSHGNIPDDAEFDFEYDEKIIKVAVKGKDITVTALKEGIASLKASAKNDKGEVAVAFCNITVNSCKHVFTDNCDETCNECGMVRKAEHNYGEFKSDNNATTEKDGTKTRTCKDCKKSETVTDEGTKIVVIVDSSKIFNDIAEDKWFKEFVDYSVSYKIFEGTSENTFSPDTTMTRAQFVQVLANISKIDTSDKNVDAGFTDVKSGKWYAPAVKWAAENEIVSGMGDGIFAPESEVTREQMCVILVNYTEKYLGKKLKVKEETEVFADNDSISSWANKDVYKCQAADLISGVGDGMFSPKTFANRAQGATIFTQFHKDYVK
jgi:uncharacterized protein YgiM (DUF1202 family)